MILEITQLDRRIDDTIKHNPTLWHEVKKTHVPAFDWNPYAYVDMGNILSNGLHEKCSRTYVIYWDGSVIRRNHSI